MRFAFILMGAFDAERDRTAIGGGAAEIAGVSNLEEACAAAKRLCASGVGCIELCAACRARGENSRAFYGAPGGAAMHGGGAACVK